MVPLNEHQATLLKNAFFECHPLSGYPCDDALTTNFNTYLELCFSTNEITGISFYQVGSDFFAIPKGIDLIREKFIWEQILLHHFVNPHSLVKPDRVIKFGIKEYWTLEDFEALENLKSFSDPILVMKSLFSIALRILNRSPQALATVCGPMSSGTRSVEENIKIFNRTLFRLGQRIPVFNVMPFEPIFHMVHMLVEDDKSLCPNGSSSKFFIDHFYSKVYAIKKKWSPHFIGGWENSIGATMEHDIFRNLKCKPFYLQDNYHVKLI